MNQTGGIHDSNGYWLSASIISAHHAAVQSGGALAVPLFSRAVGVVYSPCYMRVSCSFAGDAGTRVLSPSDGCGRAYCRTNASTAAGGAFCGERPYERLGDMLRASSHRVGYNEVILDAAAIDAHLPMAVEAFFFVDDDGGAYARLVRRAFVAAYGTGHTVPPVVRLDPSQRERPFTAR